MIWMVAWLWGCGGAQPEAPRPDPAIASAAAEAVCKLLEGARQSCEVASNQVTWGDRRLGLQAQLLTSDERFGQFSFESTVTLTEGDRVFSSRAVGFGGAKEVSVEKGLHEWAVVSGVAIVDALLEDPERPALKALDAQSVLPEGAGTLGEFKVLRGYSLIRGDKPPEEALSHGALLGALGAFVATLDATRPHVLSLHRVSGLDGDTVSCWLDGASSAPLCEAASAMAWPAGVSWELKQTYVLLPKR